MSISIKELDTAAPETGELLLPVLRAALAADAPALPEPSPAHLRMTTLQRATRARGVVAVFDGETLVGFTVLNQGRMENQDLVYGDVLILPGHRADAAEPLLDGAAAYAAAHGGKRLLFATPVSDYDALFSRREGKVTTTERRSQLDLAAIDRPAYEAWAAPSDANAGYRIVQWRAPIPEDLVASYMAANVAMNDAPTGDLEYEAPKPDVARRRRVEVETASTGVREYAVAALAPDGEVAGFHELLAFPDMPLAMVGNTGVVGAHRGHGLGLRLKAELALRIQELEPHVRFVETWNNGENEPMLRVNDALGYQAAEWWRLWQFGL